MCIRCVCRRADDTGTAVDIGVSLVLRFAGYAACGEPSFFKIAGSDMTRFEVVMVLEQGRLAVKIEEAQKVKKKEYSAVASGDIRTRNF